MSVIVECVDANVESKVDQKVDHIEISMVIILINWWWSLRANC